MSYNFNFGSKVCSTDENEITLIAKMQVTLLANFIIKNMEAFVSKSKLSYKNRSFDVIKEIYFYAYILSSLFIARIRFFNLNNFEISSPLQNQGHV